MAKRRTRRLLQGFRGIEFHQVLELHDVDACFPTHEGQVRSQPRLNITIFISIYQFQPSAPDGRPFCIRAPLELPSFLPIDFFSFALRPSIIFLNS